MKKLSVLVFVVAFAAAAFAQDIQLKQPPGKIGADLFDAIKQRATARGFVKGEVPVADLSAIL